MAVKVDISDVMKSFDQKTQKRFMRNILDRLTRLANKETKQRITTKYNIKSKDVKTKVTTTRQNVMAGYISASSGKLSLNKFGPQESGGGIAVSVVKGQSVYIEDAFIAQPKGKDYSKRGQAAKAVRRWKDVFFRKTRNAYPIDALSPKQEHSMSIGEYLGSDENMAAINNMMKRERGNIERAVVESFTQKKLDKMARG